MDDYKKNRHFLKSMTTRETSLFTSDQQKGIEEPSREKPIITNTEFIELVQPQYFTVGQTPTRECISKRQSHRVFSETALTLEELSFLLWATQGLKKDEGRQLRTVPSAGARHPFETYLYLDRVEGLMQGFYRYLPREHKLAFLFERTNARQRLADACLGQSFAGKAAAVFIWSVIPYRTEWRYHMTSYKIIAMDAGHMCQNLYLASEAINAGTCAIAAYDQTKMDMLLDLDGEDEFVVYLAPVGKIEIT